jgi:hypothetical protein
MSMTNLYQATEAKFKELAQSLEPIFGDDSRLLARALTMGLRTSFGGNPDALPAIRQREYLTALERLPRGGTALQVAFVSSYGGEYDPHWKVTFTDGLARHTSAKRVPTEAEANAYATDFLMRLHGEINREC